MDGPEEGGGGPVFMGPSLYPDFHVLLVSRGRGAVLEAVEEEVAGKLPVCPTTELEGVDPGLTSELSIHPSPTTCVVCQPGGSAVVGLPHPEIKSSRQGEVQVALTEPSSMLGYEGVRGQREMVGVSLISDQLRLDLGA